MDRLTGVATVQRRAVIHPVLRHPSAWTGVLWAEVALVVTRVRLSRNGAGATAPAAPSLPGAAGAGVGWFVGRPAVSCLERSLILQQWLRRTAGAAPDVVVGVRREPFTAHAWLEGEDQSDFVELWRVSLGSP